MAGVILPRYMLDAVGSEWQDFGDESEWVVSSGSAVPNVTEFRAGTQSVKVTSATGSYGTITKVLAAPVNFGGAVPRMRLYFYLYAADKANLSTITFQLFTSAAYNVYMECGISGAHPSLKTGWNVFDIGKKEFAVTGITASWGGNAGWNANFDRIRIRTQSTTGTTVDVSFDQLIWQADTALPGAVMLTFDDALDDIYNEAFAYMQPRGLRGTFYINTSLPGTAGNVTVANLQEMDAAGWSIGNHSDTTASLTSYSQADATSHVLAAKATLDGWGMTGASSHLAYPNYAVNDTVIAAMADAGILSARAGTTGINLCLEPNYDERYAWPCQSGVSSGHTLDSLKAYAESAYLNGQIAVYVIHSIGASANITPENFRALVDYGLELGAPFVTINDVYDLLSGPVSIIPNKRVIFRKV